MEELQYPEGIKYNSQYLNEEDEKAVDAVSSEISNWFHYGSNPLEQATIKHTTFSSFVDFWNPVCPGFAEGLKPEGDDFVALGTLATLSGFRTALYEASRRVLSIVQSNGGRHTRMTKQAVDTFNTFGTMLTKELTQIIEGKQVAVAEVKEKEQK